MEWLKENAGWIITLVGMMASFLVTVFRMGKRYKEFDMRITAIEENESACKVAMETHIARTKFELDADIESMKIDFREIKHDMKQASDTMTKTRIYIERTFGEIKSMIAAINHHQ